MLPKRLVPSALIQISVSHLLHETSTTLPKLMRTLLTRYCKCKPYTCLYFFIQYDMVLHCGMNFVHST